MIAVKRLSKRYSSHRMSSLTRAYILKLPGVPR